MIVSVSGSLLIRDRVWFQGFQTCGRDQFVDFRAYDKPAAAEARIDAAPIADKKHCCAS
jgi:hypothetical protein